MSKVKSLLLTVVGNMITAFGVSLFLTPNKIVGGGVSGISIILFNTVGVPVGVSYAVINALLLLVGIKVLSKQFIIKTLIGSGLLSVFIEIFSLFPVATNDLMISSVFGGLFYGIGLAITFVAGASTGGSDILGRIIQSKFKFFPIGKILMVLDIIIISISLLVFDEKNLVFYGLISAFVSAFIIDKVMQSLNVSKIAFVITEKGEEISDKIVTSSPRGVTLIDCVGGYTNTDKKVLFCAMKEKEIPLFQDKVISIDENAFIVYAKSTQILGNGFYIYK